ncbi:MAG: hypothetical protein RBU37_07990 [Myxococcota bacterium]|jgi:hypothetical protein|nr:hypothetical protein [Myxococcota bacterium]
MTTKDEVTHEGAEVVELDAHRPRRSVSPPDDAELELALSRAARKGLHRSGAAEDAHLEPEQMLAHLQRILPTGERMRVIAHLARCSECCDRLQAAAELLRIEPLRGVRAEAVEARESAKVLEFGPALMRVRLEVAGSALHVLETDAEMRLGLVAALRQSAAADGVVFRKQIAGAELRLELLDARNARLNLGLSMQSAVPGARVSVFLDGRLTQTRPFRRDQLILRGLALRPTVLRIETPEAVLGHVALELNASSAKEV